MLIVEPLAIAQFSLAESQLNAAVGRFAKQLLENPCDVALCGELGSGKTRLVKAILGHLGWSPDQVTSPSYALCHEYGLRNGIVVEHWDLYRLTSAPEELVHLADGTIIRLIEWAELFNEILQCCEVRIRIQFSQAHPEVREFFCEAFSERAKNLLQAFEQV
jgi:tRNA threonylcarbamoyladenosine biosynthesis protein TsaE